MADEIDHPKHFSAFISYSRSDIRFARKLHRRLENYQLPRQLAGRYQSSRFRRLRPIFRDIEAMPAASDITAAVRDALSTSQFLIVICSPNSAKSVWVQKEIELFREINGDSGILAALIAGSPETSFPPALHGAGAAAQARQPLAADFRPGGDGQRNALLKLVAALTAIGLDELVQRDAQRRIRQIVAFSAAALAGMLAFMAVSIVALNAQAAAERERARGGTLIGYLLTDLRGRLKTAGRLDLLEAANKGIVGYFRGQDLSHLSDIELQQRAKLLQAIGEDDEKRGDLAGARNQIEDARRTTAALLKTAPGDPDRIYAHAQSEFFAALIDWRTGDKSGAASGFKAYRVLAGRLLAADRSNPNWWMEVGWADSNLGMYALRTSDARSAETLFKTALEEFGQAARRRPGDAAIQSEIADGYGWLADARRLRGDYNGALAARTAERGLLDRLVAGDPRNNEYRASLVTNRLGMARIDLARGAFSDAIAELDAGYQAALTLARNDPENMELARGERIFELFKVRTWLAMPVTARPSAATIAAANGDCAADRAIRTSEELATFCTILRTRRLTESGDPAAAAELHVLRSAYSSKDTWSEHWGLNFADEVNLGYSPQQIGELK